LLAIDGRPVGEIAAALLPLLRADGTHPGAMGKRWAQLDTGTIVGRVSDPSGAVLPGVTVTITQVIVLVTAVVLMIALRFIVMKTKLGMAMRALSLNPTASALMGVNNSVVISFTFGLGSALAAAGGILYASLYPSIEPFMGVLPGLKAFVAAVLGGIGNIPGAALGGLIIGVTETLVAGYSDTLGIPSGYRDGVAFVILILILLFKPSGLLGKAEREKV
jgi:branched-chain amino acid transport system permease protein